jgi:hypothetical protein
MCKPRSGAVSSGVLRLRFKLLGNQLPGDVSELQVSDELSTCTAFQTAASFDVDLDGSHPTITCRDAPIAVFRRIVRWGRVRV